MNTKLPLAPAALLATLGCAVALALAPAVVAGASPVQDDTAELTIEATHPADGGVHVIVRLTQGGDGVDGATVLATPTTAAGDQLAPVTLEPGEDGEYQGFVPFPTAGTWTVRIASDDPAAAVEQTVDVAVSPSTSGPPAGSNDGGDGFTPADDETGSSAASSDDGGPPIGLIAALAVLLVGGAAVAVVATRRARRGAATPAPPTPRAPQRKAKAKPASTATATTAEPEAAEASETETAEPETAEATETTETADGEATSTDGSEPSGKVEAT
jgi:hypothetical protein